MKESSLIIKYNKSNPTSKVPLLGEDVFRKKVLEMTRGGGRVNSFFSAENDNEDLVLYLIISYDARGETHALSMKVENKAFKSLTNEDTQFHLFEREIYEQSGIRPLGHPWLKPVRFPGGNAGEMDFFKIEGREIHEVAVGPIHAGIIEPGHFRFQCHGETVYHLETSHGYQHRGIEKKLTGGPYRDTVYKMGVIAGDSTVAHSTAYAQIMEAFTRTAIPARAQAVRAIALELERCANHIGDIGALSGDIGYLSTSAYCGRIRGDFLNMSALLCGNRFSRGLVLPGGVGADIDDDIREQLAARLEAGKKDFLSAASLLWETPSVLARFDSTGIISAESAERIKMVGPAARACGIERDVRRDHPSGYYHLSYIPVSTSEMGDVSSRAYVRWLEVQESIKFIEKLLAELPVGDSGRETGTNLKPDSITVSLIEGWRGELCHTALTDGTGRFRRYKIVDPSFHNWLGLALAMRGGQISDFPVCNKSFNLSYCGFDL
ncbi:MAG: NADH-quinone oxidoreductase subunit C [Spirochaetales bacterium]|nr:NADH-quinone oxidoreductase subunit C [Spirochaetales bacterium]